MLCQRPSTYVGKLDEAMVGKNVVIFGCVLWIRPLSKTTAIVGLHDISKTVPCIIEASAEEGVTTRMVRFASTLCRGTFIDVEGVVSLPDNRKHLFDTTTQRVEIHVRKLHTIGTRPDGSHLEAASQNSSSSPSIMQAKNPVGHLFGATTRQAEIQVRK
uniref:Uncharacterized protein n=1 Tax=Triticum urartu TaxID=4572 RepID=A0A8R7P6E8_TRIUA